MLKIGEFSKLSHVSVRMLRHYDEIGLLHPQRVDPITGYRLYGEEQLFTAGKINVYRGMGFGLTAIAGLLHEADPQKLRAMLERQHGTLREQSEEMSQMLHRIKLAIAQLGRGEYYGKLRCHHKGNCSPIRSQCSGYSGKLQL